MKQLGLIILITLALTACDNFTPREKTAKYDPATRELTLPYPCPDWSQTQVHNYLNEPHSNFGCAVNTNAAIQLENPADLHHGHGQNTPDTEITADVVKKYRAGDLPAPLNPVQSISGGQ